MKHGKMIKLMQEPGIRLLFLLVLYTDHSLKSGWTGADHRGVGGALSGG